MKIAIVGYAPTKDQAPYSDPTWQIWSLNSHFSFIKRFDLWFDLHDTRPMRPEVQRFSGYFDFLVKNQEKLILTGIDERFDKANIFPQVEIIQKYGNFFTNSIAWMLAYAIEQNPSDIGLWGVNAGKKTEYEFERPCVLNRLFLADQKGINLHFPPRCKLFSDVSNYKEELKKFAKTPAEFKFYWNRNCYREI